MELLFKLVACHVIGDYFLQSSYMADKKGKDFYDLFLHCVLYAVPFYIAFGWCWQLAVVGVMHFPIDAAKARYGKISYVMDQTLHYMLCLLYFI